MTTYSKNFGLAKPRAQLFVNAPSSIRAEPNSSLTLRQAATLRCPPPPVNTLNTLNTLTKSMSMSGIRGSLQIAGKTLTASQTTEPAAPSPSDRRHALQLKTFRSRDSAAQLLWCWFSGPLFLSYAPGVCIKYMSNRQNYCNTNLVFDAPWPFRGCIEPS